MIQSGGIGSKYEWKELQNCGLAYVGKWKDPLPARRR